MMIHTKKKSYLNWNVNVLKRFSKPFYNVSSPSDVLQENKNANYPDVKSKIPVKTVPKLLKSKSFEKFGIIIEEKRST